MTSMELLELLNNVSDRYVSDARTPVKKVRTLRRPLLIAALITLTLLLVGCTVAYVNGWFTDFFSARSQDPLSPEQVEFIQEHEQIIAETQTKNGWTVELKSAICDGFTGYMLFSVTAPDDIDLEGYHGQKYGEDRIMPGNNTPYLPKRRALVVVSTGFADEEKNFIWQSGGGKGGWQEDHDGLQNTMDYLIGMRPEKLYPNRETLLEDPFGPDVEFTVRFDGFALEYENPEIRKKIDEKYAGMTDYMVEDEDLIGLYNAQLLVDETWEFSVTFDNEHSNSVELITEPVMTWALVTWKLDDEPTFYKTGSGLEAVKITSFVLNPFGATVTYDFEEPVIGAFIEYQSMFGYTDRLICAVMKDGSQIPLHTDSVGTQLTAESPIVLSEVDHILLGSGEQLFMP